MIGLRRLGLLLLLALAAGQAHAVPAWRVSAPGAPGEVLLVGSVHLLRPDDLPLPQVVEDAYAAADRLVLELDPAELEPAAAAAALERVGIDEVGHRSRDLFSESGWREVETLARNAGIDAAALAGFEPWFAAVSLYTGTLVAAGYDPALGVDQQLGLRALRDGRPARGLETLDQQLGIFKGLSPEVQRELLRKTFVELGAVAAETDQLVAAWRNTDLDALGRTLEDDFRGYPALRARLVEERNAAWTPQVAALLQQPGTSLVVVGALHLVGPEGLPERLRRQGFEVTPLEGEVVAQAR